MTESEKVPDLVEVEAPSLEEFKAGLTAQHKYQLVILYALNHKAGEMYAGTVKWRKKHSRREHNHRAKIARRHNRRT